MALKVVQVRGLVEKINFDSAWVGKILNFEKIIGGKNFEIIPPKFFKTRGSLETKPIINAHIQ